jgi:hypothetical protein
LGVLFVVVSAVNVLEVDDVPAVEVLDIQVLKVKLLFFQLQRLSILLSLKSQLSLLMYFSSRFLQARFFVVEMTGKYISLRR